MHPFTQTAIQIYSEKEDRNYAPAMEAYMKNNFPYLGIKSPDRPELIRKIASITPFPKPNEAIQVCKELWALNEREYQYLACDLLIKNCKHFQKEAINDYEYFILTKSWWDSIDYFVPKALATHFKLYPELIEPYTQKWITSGNIWLQRSAILFQLKYKKDTNLNLLYKIINSLSTSKEFFVQKAIGWILREYSKIDPEEIKRFVQNNTLKPLSKREALKVIERSQIEKMKKEEI